MIMDQAIYRDGRRLPCTSLEADLARLRAEEDGFLWIGLKDPSDDEFALVNRGLELHPLAVEDAVGGDQRAKVEEYDDNLLVVLRTLRYIERTSDIESGEVTVFVGDRFVVTVRRGDGNPLFGVRTRLEQHAEQLQLGPSAVLHAVMDSVVDNYVLIDGELERDLERIEQQVFTGSFDIDATAIYRLKREVLEFRRAAIPLSASIRKIVMEPGLDLIDEDVIPFFRDVQDHLLRVIDHIETYDRLLTDVLNAHLAQLSVRQNEDMRRISAWVAIAAVPTMIAGIYGMNFDFMPELRQTWGYPAVLVLMATACGLIYRSFRKSGWL
ncbi:MAG: magnesium/cobalt transporter CorA [Actinomycetales bacterium]|nr:magnesium/cobalt transporter CorA [Candidatus Lutibacillus vidarii]HON75726.1 magnesium/cobalt transporter CorA [Dermatophilaceae bacterium]HRB98599.1 magnesium/cobalt transporter CorA [Dermatophilaceae bacterium]